MDESKLLRGWTLQLERLLGVETRGIERVPESDRPAKASLADFVQIMLIWFSANLTLNNLALGLLGPVVYYVGLKDAMWIGAFGSIAGSIPTAYISIFGPMSGNRTLVLIAVNCFPSSHMLILLPRFSHVTPWVGGLRN